MMNYRKINAPYYPDLLRIETEDKIEYCCWVRFIRGDVWYRVFLLQTISNIIYRSSETIEMKIIMEEAHKIQHCFLVTLENLENGFVEVDLLQITERERLLKK